MDDPLLQERKYELMKRLIDRLIDLGEGLRRSGISALGDIVVRSLNVPFMQGSSRHFREHGGSEYFMIRTKYIHFTTNLQQKMIDF